MSGGSASGSGGFAASPSGGALDGWTQVLAAARQAEAQARASGDDRELALALWECGRALNELGRPREALEALLGAVGFLPPEEQAQQARCWHQAAWAQHDLAGETGAQEYLSLALRLAREAGERSVELDVLEDLAEFQVARGQRQAALDSLHAYVAARRALPGQRGLARALVRLAQVSLSPAPSGAALTGIQDWLAEALALLDGSGGPPGSVAGEARAALAETRLRLGQPEQALAQAQRALEELRACGAGRAALRVVPLLARTHLALGDGPRALQVLDSALGQVDPDVLAPERAALHLAACDVHQTLGQPEPALAHHRAYHALDSQQRQARVDERSQAAQARVGLDVTRHEARVQRERGDALELLVQARTADLRRNQRAVIDLLAGAAEFRDAPLGPHTRWVGDAAAAVARELGLDAIRAEELGLAARLHDVGKIAIPDAILLSEGPLSAPEWAVMRTHVTLGARLLTQPGALDGGGPLLELAAQIALTHHECWDGSGYPSGLRGEAIPLGGRIVRVVDTFDALVTDRPYKPAWSGPRALAHLLTHRGTLFDPVVVGAFAALSARHALPPRI